LESAKVLQGIQIQSKVWEQLGATIAAAMRGPAVLAAEEIFEATRPALEQVARRLHEQIWPAQVMITQQFAEQLAASTAILTRSPLLEAMKTLEEQNKANWAWAVSVGSELKQKVEAETYETLVEVGATAVEAVPADELTEEESVTEVPERDRESFLAVLGLSILLMILALIAAQHVAVLMWAWGGVATEAEMTLDGIKAGYDAMPDFSKLVSMVNVATWPVVVGLWLERRGNGGKQ
jgi:hypothetical protein